MSVRTHNHYQKVWMDKDFRKYSLETKSLFLFLLTNANSSGVTEFDEDLFSYIMRIDESDIQKSIKELTDFNKILYDKQTSEIFLINHFKHNNPAASTIKHKIKFNFDFQAIKSEKIKNAVEEKAKPSIEMAKKIIAEKEKEKKSSRGSQFKVKKPSVDK